MECNEDPVCSCGLLDSSCKAQGGAGADALQGIWLMSPKQRAGVTVHPTFGSFTNKTVRPGHVCTYS